MGDAAGQCEPLTGAGIGAALYFGLGCAGIVQKVIDKEISLEAGLQHYNELVKTYHHYYSFLEGFQKRLLSLPDSWRRRFMMLISYRPLCHFLLKRYQRHGPVEQT